MCTKVPGTINTWRVCTPDTAETPEPVRDAPKPRFVVSVRRTIACSVTVEAESEEAAEAIVSQRDFPLPPRDEWDGVKDWEIEATAETGPRV